MTISAALTSKEVPIPTPLASYLSTFWGQVREGSKGGVRGKGCQRGGAEVLPTGGVVGAGHGHLARIQPGGVPSSRGMDVSLPVPKPQRHGGWGPSAAHHRQQQQLRQGLLLAPPLDP